MAKPTRKKRRRRRQPRQHNFSAKPKATPVKTDSKTISAAPASKKPSTRNFLTPPPGQRSDIIMTLTIAGIICSGFGLIAYFDSNSHFLVRLGQQLTNFLGLSL